MSSPSTTTRGSRSSITSMAELSAWTMFMRAMGSGLAGGRRCRARGGARLLLRRAQRAQLVLLRPEVGWHVLQHVLEHGERIERRSAGERAVALGLFPAGADVRLELLLESRVALLGPLAKRDQVLLEARDRIAERPRAPLVLGAILRRIVAGRMGAGAIGDELDQRRAAALARALRSPLRDRIDGEEIVAVDANPRDTVPRSALREGAMLAA